MRQCIHIPVKIVQRLFVSAAALMAAICLPSNLHAAAPTIVSVVPAPGSTISSLTRVTVTFSVPIAGAQGSDLMVADTPALAAAVTNATVTFTFSQPAPGAVIVNFDSDAVITDLSGNLFDTLAPNAVWTYTLADNVPPVVAATEPAAGSILESLNQIEVAFNEPVSGVDAGDLVVNGVAATSVATTSAQRYVFSFPAAANGAVNLSWAAGHGIADLSPAANAFAATGWSYTVNPTAATTVVLNELLADNRNSIEDADSQKEDWIELRNTGAAAVNLGGWALTDDATEPAKWVFPNISLAAGQYLIVFASGKDRKTIAANATNHTNFRLNLGGGYLGLFKPGYPRVAASEFNYPEQRADISYGRTAGGALVHFATMTPRAANNDASAASGFALPPHASVRSGIFNQPFNLVLSTETAGAEIRYTIDGRVPTLASEPYTGPITIAGTATRAVATIRAAAFRPGLVPSSVTTRTYIFPEQVMLQSTNPPGFPSIWDSPCTGFNNCNDINPADYEMDPQVLTNTVDNYRALALQGLSSIPTVSIVTDVNLLFGAAEGVYVRREPFLRKPISAEFITTDGSEGFQIDCGLEMQGQTSPDDSSTGGSKWKSLKLGLRLFFQGEFGPTKLNYKVFEDSPVDSFDTLLLGGGHNNYWNYNNNDTQRIRSLYVRDQYVANLQNALGGLSHHGRFVHLYLNGLYWGLYQMHERPDANFQAAYQGGEAADYNVFKHDAGAIVDGSNASYTAMWALINSGLTSNASYEQLQQVLDVPGLIDYLFINFWANNTDWDHKNLYASQRKVGGKWQFHAWDSEHVVASADFAVLDDNNGTNPTAIFRRLLNNAEFRVLLADQIHKRFFNDGIFYVDTNSPIYNPAFPERNPAAHMFMNMLKEIDTAIVCESARWGDVGPGRENTPHTRNTSFYEERDIVMGNRATFGSHSPVFFPTRSSQLLAQFRTRGWYPNVVAPAFNQHGGRVAPGFGLNITAPAGTIYYTTNGNDPRLYASGAVSPQAIVFSGAPLSIGRSMTVMARVLTGTNWSALNEASFIVAELASPIRITEINYNPVGGDAYEFIELRNTGSQPVNLGGGFFEGITFVFAPNTVVSPGATIVLANNGNPAAFAARYPGAIVAGYFAGSLANGGERIALKDASGRTLVSVNYRDNAGWPTKPDGGGSSLELVDVNGASSDPSNWQASSGNGSPGQPNPAPTAAAVVLNEVAAETGSAVSDWIELRNTTASPVNLDGWSLSDDGNARKFVFSGGTTIPANSFLVVWCDAITNTTPGIHTGFALDRENDNVFLYNTQTQRIDAVSFGLQVANFTLGRIGNAWTLNTPTPNEENVAAALGAQSDLSINEWLANATPGTDDWIELYNKSATHSVPLSGLHFGTTGALFQVRSLAFLPPGGFVQLLADENAGPNHLDFKLPAAGGEIALYDSAAVLIERVAYTNQAQGLTLGRLPNGGATIVAFPGSASPAASNYVANYTGPVLNEVLARNTSGLAPWGSAADWIELANNSASPVSLAGMSVGARIDAVGQWTFPTGATLPANGFLRLWCDGNAAASILNGTDLNTGFSLSGESGGVFLFNVGGQLVDSIEHGFQVTDLSIGRSGASWRLLASPTPGAVNSATATLGAMSAVKLNEWMSEPLAGNDWFELFNTAAQPVELTGLYLTDDPSILGRTKHRIAPLSFIGAKSFVKFEADGDPSQGADHAGFNLDRLGESLRLYATNLTLLDSADLLALPAGVSAGRLPDGTANTVAFYTTPTPEQSNHLPISSVKINEVLTHTDTPLEDSIELQNTGTQAVNLGGYFLSDNAADFRKFRIADGTSLAAGAFVVFGEGQFNNGAPGSFALSSSRGGIVWLSAADAGGNLTGYRTSFPFGPQVNGVSFGRVQTSVGDDVSALTARTLGSANAAAKIGPVVINEIQYHPDDAGVENAADEFIELHNVSGSTVGLFDAAHPTNTWRLSGGVSFRFPPNASLAPRAYLLVVRFNPLVEAATLAAFRAKHGLPLGVAIYGPFSGRLGNDGDTLALEMPDNPQGPGPEEGFVPYVVVDRVSYGDSTPWPAGADGTGASLQRRRPYAYGNDPLNWNAIATTAGRVNVSGSTFADLDQDGLPDDWENANGLSSANAADAQQDLDGDTRSNYEEYLDGTDITSAGSGLTAPSITVQPADSNANLSEPFVLNVSASGSAPLQYQWLKNGFPIAYATNAALDFGIAGTADGADYSAVVRNAAGFAVSRSARVTVVIPPRITLQPVGLSVLPGSNVTFTVAAVGTGTIRYQWRKDGVDIPGATLATLSVPNAQLVNEGEYQAVVSDDLTTIQSVAVRLIVRVAPTFVVQPVGSTNAAGSSVTFTVVANGSLPMGFIWRKGSVAVTNFVGMSRSNTFTISNLRLSDSAGYRVVITNAANPNPGVISATATLLVLDPPRLSDVVRLGDGSVRFNVTGTSNRLCTIEGAAVPGDWTVVGTLNYTNGLMPFTDASASALTNRFYRARQ